MHSKKPGPSDRDGPYVADCQMTSKKGSRIRRSEAAWSLR